MTPVFEMHFAFVVSSNLGYRIPDLFHTGNSMKRFKAALRCLRENGFDGVELNLDFSGERKLEAIRKAVTEADMKLAAVGTGLLYVNHNLSFADPSSTKRTKALSIVKELIRFAANVDAIVIVGLVRGRPQNEKARSYVGKCLVECDSAAEKYGTKIGVEAINRYESSFLNTAVEVNEYVGKLNLTSTGILLDTFHMNTEEKSLEETIRNYREKIVHFHIADSNRLAPGCGHLKISGCLRLLESLGYKGWASAEVLSKPSNVEVVQETAEFLRSSGLNSC